MTKVAYRALTGGERRGTVFVLLAGLSLLVFLGVPAPLETKSLALLHGLCAQTPDHSFWFGVVRLPFDARMTGIYGGFLVTQLYLLTRGRVRAAGLPSLPIVLLLGGFAVAMGIDGFNSLLDDTGLPAIYPPTNALRYITGALMGTTLGAFLWLLTAATLWRPDLTRREPALRGWRDLAAVLVLASGFGLAAGSGVPALYTPITLLLIGAAVLALFEIALVLIMLGRARVSAAATPRDLAGPALGALLGAYATLMLLSAGRYALEAVFPVMTKG